MTDISYYLTYLEEQRLLICNLCKHAISPSSRQVDRHLRRIHSHTIPLEPTRKNLVEYVTQLPPDLCDRHPVSISITEGILAFACLDTIPGYRCDEDGCSYLAMAESTMKDHCWTRHKWVKSAGMCLIYPLLKLLIGNIYSECNLQTFFPSHRLKYFVVVDPASTRTSSSQNNIGSVSKYQSIEDILQRANLDDAAR